MMMLKQIELRYGGAAAQVGGQDLLRVLPNRFVDCIGPFTFLDYFPEEFQRSGGILQGLQFWINLPAKNKAEEPAYKPLQSDEIPEYKLDMDRGRLRVLIGGYGEHFSSIPVYSQQFLYHIILNAGGVFPGLPGLQERRIWNYKLQ